MKSADYKSIIPLTETRFFDADVKLYIGKFKGFWQCCVEQDGDINQTGGEYLDWAYWANTKVKFIVIGR